MLFLVVRYFVLLMIGWLSTRGAGGRCLQVAGDTALPLHSINADGGYLIRLHKRTRLVGLINAQRTIERDWRKLFSSFCCFHDHGEGVSFQRSAASAPSMSGCANSSAALEALTEPPYWIITTCSAIFASALTMWSRDEFVHCRRLRRYVLRYHVIYGS